MVIQEVTALALNQRLQESQPLFLLDVREAHEVAICAIGSAKHIAMNLVPIYLDELPDEMDIVIYCHHGVRSLAVANWLINNGFESTQIYSLAGGIDAWAQMVEPDMVRY